MRAFLVGVVVLAISIAASPARADEFADAMLGIAIPAGNSDWTKLVGTSPKLALRGGVLSGDLGGMLAVDWTPESLANGGSSFGLGSTSGSLQRFRVLASAMVRHRIAPRITLTGRAGAGIDIAHASIDVTAFGSTTSTTDTDVGYAFEFGAGVWFDVAHTQLGFELAVPIGHHDKQAQQAGDLPFNYTDIDIDLLVGIRI